MVASTRRWGRIALAGAAVVAALALVSAGAGATTHGSARAGGDSAVRGDCCVYWSTGTNSAIGRAPFDGRDPRWNFLRSPTAGAFGFAVDAEHLYWGGDGSITRSELSGANAETLIGGLGAGRISGLAVEGAYLYWAQPASDRIGRAALDGSGVDESFIETFFPTAVAVDAGHIYWSWVSNAIGRANLDGSAVDESFITGVDLPAGVAVDGAHVYWTSFGSEVVGRANLDGSAVEVDFIPAPGDPLGLAVDASHLYWSDPTSGAIGRANLDGSDARPGFIEEVGAFGVATGPPGEIGAARPGQSRVHRGKLKIKVQVSAEQRLTARAGGSLEVRKPGSQRYQLQQLPPKSASIGTSGIKVLTLKPAGKRNRRRVVRKLMHGAVGTAAVRVTLTDELGNEEIERMEIKVRS